MFMRQIVRQLIQKSGSTNQTFYFLLPYCSFYFVVQNERRTLSTDMRSLKKLTLGSGARELAGALLLAFKYCFTNGEFMIMIVK